MKQEESPVKEAGLGPRDFVKGTTVIAAVAGVHPRNLELQLPNNIVGHVLKADTLDIEDSEAAQVSLSERFHRGKLVIAVVLNNSANDKSNRIQLSLKPSLINAGFRVEKARPGMWLACNVRGNEDYGWSVEFGDSKQNRKLSGFVKRDETLESSIRIGEIAYVELKEINHGARHCISLMTPNPDNKLDLKEEMAPHLIRAGMVVECQVCSITGKTKPNEGKKGNELLPESKSSQTKDKMRSLRVKLLGSVLGSISATHVVHPLQHNGCYWTDESIRKKPSEAKPLSTIVQKYSQALSSYKVSQKVIARVVAVLPSPICPISGVPQVQVYLTLLPHLVRWMTCEFGFISPGLKLSDAFAYSVDSRQMMSVVAQVDQQRVVAAICPPTKMGVSRTSKDRNTGKKPTNIVFNEGQKYDIRITDSNMLEGFAIATADPRALNATYFCTEDMKPGMIVTGEVVKISTNMLKVKVSEYVFARVTLDHLSDKPRDEMPKKFVVGLKTKFRVLYVDPHYSIVALTAKPSFLKDCNPLTAVNANVLRVNQICVGYVSATTTGTGLRASFYGRETAHLSQKEISYATENGIDIRPGATIRVKVAGVDYFRSKFTVSFDLDDAIVEDPQNTSPSQLANQETSSFLSALKGVHKSFSEGDSIPSPTVLAICRAGIYVAFKPTNDELLRLGYILTHHLSDTVEEAESLHRNLQGGVQVPEAIVLSRSAKLEGSELLRFTKKSQLKLKGLLKNDLLTLKEILKAGEKSPYGVGAVPILSCKESLRKGLPNGEFCRSKEEVGGLAGKSVHGYVRSLTTAGAFVSLGGWNVVGLAPLMHITNGFVNGEEHLKQLLKVGQTVVCRPGALYSRGNNALCFDVDLRTSAQSKPKHISAFPFLPTKRWKALIKLAATKYPESTLTDGNILLNINVGDTPRDDDHCDEIPCVYKRQYVDLLVSREPLISCRVHITELCDDFVENPWENLQLKDGDLVQVRILGPIARPNKYLRACLEGTMRLSAICKTPSTTFNRPLTVDSVSLEEEYPGYIVNSGKSGIFVSISRQLVVRVKLRELMKTPVIPDTVSKLFPIGNLVKAVKLIEIDTEKGLLEGSVRKSSHTMERNAESEAITEERHSERNQPGVLVASSRTPKVVRTTVSADSVVSSTELQPPAKSTKRAKKLAKDGESAKESNMHTENVTSDLLTVEPTSSPIHVEDESLLEHVSWGWNDLKFSETEKKRPLEDDETASGYSSSEDSITTVIKDASKKTAKRRKTIEKKSRELEIQRAEERAAANDAEPQSVDDFECELMGQHNNPKLWIRYMGFLCSLGDLAAARKVAERAIERISCREEKSRFAVWMAYLHMECKHQGNVEDVFKRALQYNDQKATFIQMSVIQQRNGLFHEALATCRAANKRFSTSKKVWLRIIEMLYSLIPESGKLDFDPVGEARKELALGLTKVPKAKRSLLNTAAARLEYQVGNIEQGESYFQKMLANDPKRLDIWSQFFDANISKFARKGEEELGGIRKIFRQAATLQLKPRKMKFIFSRWLAFERQHGTPEGEHEVQSVAKEYVERVA